MTVTRSLPRLAAPSARSDRLPPHVFFLISAVFHYLGPSFAVLLFARIEPLGVAWLRIATAALIFAFWTRPWRTFFRAAKRDRIVIVGLGITLGAMNGSFYLAIDRLPLATVAAIEFVAVIGVALVGVAGLRNLAALLITLAGVYALIGFTGGGDRFGLFLSVLNAVLFAAYIVLGHKLSRSESGSPIERLGAAMLIALLFAAPFGFMDAAIAFTSPALLLAGFGVGVTSSVIPYVCDQLAMRRLPRPTFALMLALLPATAAIVGALVLRQAPSPVEIAGILLVVLGIAVHKPAA